MTALPNGPQPPRKARPPSAFVSPVSFDTAGTLTCRVSFHASNGEPTHAVLLPVQLRNARWTLQPDDPREAGDEPLSLWKRAAQMNATSFARFGVVSVSLQWPSPRVQYALLLLLHSQIEDAGDDADVSSCSTTALPPGEPGVAGQLHAAVLRCLAYQPASALERGVVFRQIGDVRVPIEVATLGPASLPQNQVRLPIDAFSFAVASCQYPPGLLDAGIRSQREALEERDIGPAERSLWRLASCLQADQNVAFTVFAGDQVYVDATAGLFDPKVLVDKFAFAYDRMFRNKGFQRLLRIGGVDVVPMLDDHEIRDNYEPRPSLTTDADISVDNVFEMGKTDYIDLQRSMWPAPAPRNRPLFDLRSLHGVDMFFADTRTEREGRWVGNYRDASIMSDRQRAALKDWIDQHGKGTAPAFVVSASILLPRLLLTRAGAAMALHSDSWCGYPKSMHEVLAWCFDAAASRIVFLSGDEHISCLATIQISCEDEPGKFVQIHSLHSSALYAPFPFANTKAEDFPAQDAFDFEQVDSNGRTRRFRCSVDTYFPGKGDGFAVIHAQRDGSGGWALGIEFNGERGIANQTIHFEPTASGADTSVELLA